MGACHLTVDLGDDTQGISDEIAITGFTSLYGVLCFRVLITTSPEFLVKQHPKSKNLKNDKADVSLGNQSNPKFTSQVTKTTFYHLLPLHVINPDASIIGLSNGITNSQSC